MRKTRRFDDTPAVTLAQFTIHEQLCFIAGWQPPRASAPVGELDDRWRDWAEFLRDFEAVRDELLARRHREKPLFGDLALRYRRAHGAAALDDANFYQIRGED